MHPFDNALSVCIENIEFDFKNNPFAEWSNFLLNPRRLRGSDFLMRWSQGVWSEERITQAVNKHGEFFIIPYGPSGTAPDNDVRAFELYFERLEAAGLGEIKRPDLLVFKKEDENFVINAVENLGGISELPFTPETDANMQNMLSKALVGIECENSLWKGKLMPDFGAELKPQKRLGGKLGLKKNAVLPTIIIKEEDREPLQSWQNANGILIHSGMCFLTWLLVFLSMKPKGSYQKVTFCQPNKFFRLLAGQRHENLFTSFIITMAILWVTH